MPNGGTLHGVALQYNDSYSDTIFSFANNINTVDGGIAPERLPQRPDAHHQRRGQQAPGCSRT
jgi:hypothetical protein